METLNIQYSKLKWLLLITCLISSTSFFAQRSLGLDKKGKVKRIHFYEGHRIKVKLNNKEKVAGTINGIFDSSFVINDRKILLSDINTVYSKRPVFRFLGSVFIVSAAFYIGIDVINNLLNYDSRGYVLSRSAWPASMASIGTGLVLYHFGTRRTKVQNNLKVYKSSPISIVTEEEFDSKISSCSNTVQATLKNIKLDGCSWVLILDTGEKLNPLNIDDFLTEELLNNSPIIVKVTFSTTKFSNTCMNGHPVIIRCIESIK